jgi:hypothetical protein
MSLNYILDWIPYEFEHEGEKISMEIRPLKSWASILLTPFLIEAGKQRKDNENNVLTVENLNLSYELQKVADKIFSDHVRDIRGITINSNPVTLQELCQESVFAPVVMNIIGQLTSITRLTKEEAKN